jgi:hypothetical protein
MLIESSSSGENSKIFGRLKAVHAAAAVFMGIQTIAYGAVGASAYVQPTVGFPTECNGPICSPDIKILGKKNAVFKLVVFKFASEASRCAFKKENLFPDVG